jgi:hypothetical protein
MTESEIWQIIQTGNEISVMRTEVFITVTVGVLIISTIDAIRLSKALLIILLGTYLTFGYINFTMLIGEMEILLNGVLQLQAMVSADLEVSLMGQYLAAQASEPVFRFLIPILHMAFWIVTLSTMTYSVWQYIRKKTNNE